MLVVALVVATRLDGALEVEAEGVADGVREVDRWPRLIDLVVGLADGAVTLREHDVGVVGEVTCTDEADLVLADGLLVLRLLVVVEVSVPRARTRVGAEPLHLQRTALGAFRDALLQRRLLCSALLGRDPELAIHVREFGAHRCVGELRTQVVTLAIHLTQLLLDGHEGRVDLDVRHLLLWVGDLT